MWAVVFLTFIITRLFRVFNRKFREKDLIMKGNKMDNEKFLVEYGLYDKFEIKYEDLI